MSPSGVSLPGTVFSSEVPTSLASTPFSEVLRATSGFSVRGPFGVVLPRAWGPGAGWEDEDEDWDWVVCGTAAAAEEEEEMEEVALTEAGAAFVEFPAVEEMFGDVTEDAILDNMGAGALLLLPEVE